MNSIKNERITLTERIDSLLNDGKPQAALELIIKSKQKNPAMENVRAVCLMRSGKFQEAVTVLTELVFPGRTVGVAGGLPVVYLTNLAVSMLKVNNTEGALLLFQQVEQEDPNHPAVVKLSRMIGTWKRSLNIFQRLLLSMGITPRKPVAVENADGDLQ
jgi:Flp pilus assembly protein TadD